MNYAWVLVGIGLVAVSLLIAAIVLAAHYRSSWSKPAAKRARARHLRSSSSSHLLSNQSVIAQAIAQSTATTTTATNAAAVAVAATTTTSADRSAAVSDAVSDADGDVDVPVWRRWMRGAQGAVAQGLIEFKRQDYRRQARLQENRMMVGAHAVAYLDRPQSVGKPIVLLLHGFCGDKDLWVWMAKEVPDDYRVVIPDLPGFGDSSRIATDQYDSKSQSNRMRSFVQTLLGATKVPVHVVGNSMGGNIAGRMVIDGGPGEFGSLTLMDALGVGSPVMSPVGQQILAGANPLMLTSPDQFDAFMKWVFVKPPSLPSFVLKYLAEKIIVYQDFNRKIFADLATLNDELTSQLHHITAPTLVLWGSHDQVIDVSAAHLFHTKIPHSKLAILDQCGHAPMAEQPKLTAHHLLALLNPLPKNFL